MAEDRYGLALTSESARAVAAYREGVDRILLAAPGADRAFEDALEADGGFALAADRARAHPADPRPHPRGQGGGGTRPRARGRRSLGASGSTWRPSASCSTATRRARWPPCGPMSPSFRATPSCSRLAVGAFGLIAFSGRPDHNALLLALLEPLAPHYAGDWWFPFAHGWAYNEARRPAEARRSDGGGARAAAAQRQRARMGWPTSPTRRATSKAGAATSRAGCPSMSAPRRSTATCPGTWRSSSWRAGKAIARSASTRTASRPAPRSRLRSTRSATPPPSSGASASTAMGAAASAGAPSVTSRPRPSRARLRFRRHPLRAGLCRTRGLGGPGPPGGGLPRGRPRRAAARRAGGGGAGRGARCLRRGQLRAARSSLIEPVAGEVIRLGGSHAQRDVFEETLIQAYLRAGLGGQGRGRSSAGAWTGGRRPGPGLAGPGAGAPGTRKPL